MSKRFLILGLVAGAGSIIAMAMAGCSGSTADNGNPDASNNLPDTGSDSPMRPDTGMDAGTDGSNMLDAAADVVHQVLDSGPLQCGANVCTGNNVCCTYVTQPPPPPDGGNDGGEAGAGDGGGPNITFMCQAACTDGGTELQCDSPQQCPSGSNICCATIDVIGSGSCSIGSVSSKCTNTCTTNFSFQPFCPATDTVRFCAQKADCTESQATECCTFNIGGRSETFCVNSLVAQFGGGQCLQ
jgi:hypothetical protein